MCKSMSLEEKKNISCSVHFWELISFFFIIIIIIGEHAWKNSHKTYMYESIKTYSTVNNKQRNKQL